MIPTQNHCGENWFLHTCTVVCMQFNEAVTPHSRYLSCQSHRSSSQGVAIQALFILPSYLTSQLHLTQSYSSSGSFIGNLSLGFWESTLLMFLVPMVIPHLPLDLFSNTGVSATLTFLFHSFSWFFKCYLHARKCMYTNALHPATLTFPVFHRHWFYKWQGVVVTPPSKSLRAFFPMACFSFLSLSHFGNSYISDFFSVAISVIVTNGL